VAGCEVCSGNYQDGELLVARSIWNEIATEPKSRKGKAPIPIIGKLAIKLEAHSVRLAVSPRLFSSVAGLQGIE
jgi:hypothetical protein